MSNSFWTFPWSGPLIGLGLGVVVLVALVLGRVHLLSKHKARDKAEQLAQLADAEHEGARTRHEGGP
jgi:hypothetical protein